MIPSLVWASMRQRPGRSLLLLLGYALGVGVTVALLSIPAPPRMLSSSTAMSMAVESPDARGPG